MSDVVVRLDAARPAETLRPEDAWLPAETPIAMPLQVVQAGEPWDDALTPDSAKPSTSPSDVRTRRVILFGATFVLAALAHIVPVEVYSRNGFTAAEVVAIGLFSVLMLGLACWFCSAVAGFITLRTGRSAETIRFAEGAPHPRVKTALLMPLYNEDSEATFARLRAIDASLARIGAQDAFDIFVLSDTNKEAIATRERLEFAAFKAEAVCPAYYRRRTQNIERKPGNLKEWLRRFGGGYAHMVVLDADSVMSGETLCRLVDAMERHADVGLIQTAPVIVGAESLFARAQQFGVRLYGRVACAGFAWWTGAEGSYWGHNAIVRVRAFAESCGLPTLRGPKPFGGSVMSHDVVEAALLRRAGWGVHVTAELDGSFEEAPPGPVEFLQRDRRWCQGNLQHLALLTGPGLHWINRLQFMMGCMAYLVSPVWFAFLTVGVMIEAARLPELAAEALRVKAEALALYDEGLPLPPLWPRFEITAEMLPTLWTLALTVVLLFGPKILGVVLALGDRDERRAFGGGLNLVKSVAFESVLSALMAPIVMVAHTRAVIEILLGRDSGWARQNREADGLTWKEAFAVHRLHLWVGLAFAGVLVFLPHLQLWFAPIVLPLLFAGPIAILTSRRRYGLAARRHGLLLTPEEAPAAAVPQAADADAAADADLALARTA